MGGDVRPEGEFFFARQVTLDPLALDDCRMARRGEDRGRLLFDISDYLAACLGGQGLTGIQRVQACVVQELLSREGNQSIVMVDPLYGRVWKLNDARLADLVALASDASEQRNTAETIWIGQDLHDTARLIELASGDALVSLGTFWDRRYASEFIQRLTQAGCAYVPFIYDLIPLEYPDLCEAETVVQFGRALPQILRDATVVLTASRAVETAVRSFVVGNGMAQPSIRVVPLAHQLPPGQRDGNKVPVQRPPNDRPGLNERFVLCVGTFEPRKNQVRLAEAWATLAREITDLPILALVGKIGWLGGTDFLRLDALARISGKIMLLHGLSDVRLAELYRNCLFTVFVPITEGWGLPVGESLAFGKACVASATGSIPEVGGVFPVYVDPLDAKAMMATLRRLVIDAAYRRRLEGAISRDFRARGWSDVATELLTAIDGLN